MLAAVLLAAVLPALSGCSDVAYYWQAGMGQLEILNRRRPIEEVLRDPQVAEAVKSKLRLIQRAQGFGVQMLALPDAGRFRYYADLRRKHVSWLVVAAEAYALKEVKQCFLVVGCLGYRGFFDPAEAKAFAATMTAQGYDALVRPVVAYSTLGWFDDPVLSTYIRTEDLRLVSTILHEQAHRLLFIKGDTAFNESFAVFVAEEGLRRFVRAQAGQGGQGTKGLARHLARKAERERFRRIVLRGRARLEELYKKLPPPAERAAAKARVFARLREDYQKVRESFKIMRYDRWFEQQLNNAHLVGFLHYRGRVGAFRALLARHGGDLARFFEAARQLSLLPPAEREARLDALEETTLAESRTSPG